MLILTHILHHKSNTLDIFIYIFTFRGVNPGSRSALTLGVDVFFFFCILGNYWVYLINNNKLENGKVIIIGIK